MHVLGSGLLVLGSLYLAIGSVVYLRDSAISQGGGTLSTHVEPISYLEPFDRTGTLVYFREGTGRVNAYLMYQVASSTYSKILNITSQTACDIQTFHGCPGSVTALRAAVGGGPVRVTGTFRDEELYAEVMIQR